MICNEQLAIASVPLQRWDRVYDENEALENGTVFPALNKPFFITVSDGQEKNGAKGSLGSLENSGTDQEKMLLLIQKVSFIVDDVRLYMDTHPDDAEGLSLLKEALKKRKELKRILF